MSGAVPGVTPVDPALAVRRRKVVDVFRVASGNFLEQYDFFVYGFYASYTPTH